MKFKCLFSLLALAVWLAGIKPVAAGEISPAGEKLTTVLESMNVEKLWLAGAQVDWQTGVRNGKVYANTNTHTHCSAFAAAAAEKLGVYLLRPPEHSAVLLANAQQTWLCGRGTNDGWRFVKTAIEAQQLANAGELVVVTCKNPDPARPGHIAIVRPSTKSDSEILAEGPDVIQAGARNYTRTSAKEGFRNHPGAFDHGQLMYFAHPLSSAKLALLDEKK